MPKKSLKKFRREFIIPLVAGLTIILATAAFVLLTQRTAPAPVSHDPGLKTRAITVGTAKITAEVAVTDSEQQQGLSDRPTLGANAGMIFPLPSPSKPSFWMPRMHFPLDFIYLESGRVVELKENVSNIDLTPFAPRLSVDAVLEVNAGYVAAHGINVGDKADY
jgi:uncharacterized membrane protein (UPF0127 family)